MKRNIFLILFYSILVLGFTLRVYNLSGSPAGFFCDEASIGYNAYRILTTGTDEFGTHFPLFFRAFGEYKSPIQIYSTVPFVWIFGLNEFSTRLPSAIYGTLSLIAIYLLTREFFKYHKKVNLLAIFTMFFLAISPWVIHFSRIAFELMPFIFFTTFALYLLEKTQTRPKLLPFAVASFVFALYSYFPGRIFIPLFGMGLFFIYLRFFVSHMKQTIISFFVLILLLVPFIQNQFSPAGLARWQQVSIISNPPKNESPLRHIASNYFRHFSADFLFLKGDIDMPGQFITRHSVRGMGELYLFQLPLVVFGLWSLFRRKNKMFLIMLLWLILYPVGSMFTVDDSPQATRSIIGVIPFQILSSVGAIYLLHLASKMKKPLYFASVGIASVIVLVSFVNYLSLYFVSYPKYSSDFWGWQYGARDIVAYFSAHSTSYDDFIMAPEFNAPGIFFKFYAPGGCSNCKIGLPDNSYIKDRKQLFAITPAYITSHSDFIYSPVKTIYYPNGKLAFILTEITNLTTP